MGIVYKGFDPVIERYVAIKTIRHDAPELAQQDIRARFIREAQAAGRLHHPNIVGIYEYGKDSDRDFIAMELVDGISLSEHIRKHGRLKPTKVCATITKVLEALNYAHSMGIIHRDIKPGNIMLASDGAVKVTDFGIARIESSTLTQVGTVVGTPSYMSPEQLLGQNIDHRSDIFAVGTLLYKLLTGERPFPGTKLTTLVYNIVHREHTSPSTLEPSLSGDFDDILAKALAKKPEDRFQTATEFATALSQAAQKFSQRGEAANTGTVVRVAYSEKTAQSDHGFSSTASSQSDPLAKKQSRSKSARKTTGMKIPLLILSSAISLFVIGAGFAWFYLRIDLSVMNTADHAPSSTLTSPHSDQTENSTETEPAASSPANLPPLDSKQHEGNQQMPVFEVGQENQNNALLAREQHKTGDSFQDCVDCPDLVVIPKGSFMQGSPASEIDRFANEGPQRYVSLNYSLAVAKHEISRSEFARFANETGHQSDGCWTYDEKWEKHLEHNWQTPGFNQDDRHPVTCVSWNDAKAYVNWLSQKTGKTYRLLSESEWEYITRAHAESARTWGDDPELACISANVADLTSEQHYNGWEVHRCVDGYVYTAPAGSFTPNGFGLYDMLGNVFEWVEDCWNDNYLWAPLDGSAWTEGDCRQRVLRGGSWFSMPKYLRFAFRNRFDADYRSSSFGFRVARVLNREG